MKKLWESITLIGHQKLDDPTDLRQLKLLNSIATVGTLNLCGFIPIAIFLQLPAVVAYVSTGVLLSSFTFFLNFKGYFKVARTYFVLITLAFVTAILTIMSGKNGGSQIVFVLVGTLHLVLFKNTKWAIQIFLAVIVVFALSSYWVENHSVYLDYLSSELKRFAFYMNILSTMILVFAVVLYFKIAALEFENTITEQNKKISQKNKDITDSITYAKRLQEAILPPHSYIKSILPDNFVLYKPKDIVAGDFYWLENNEDEVLFAAADCTGHGVPGAMVSVVCSNALNRAVKEFVIKEPAKILDKVRELVIETFEKSESEVKDGMDISLCSFNKITKVLQWAGANNPIWFIQKNKWNEIKPNKQPIGKYSQLRPFTNHQIELNTGDTLFIFTDGFADQFGGPKGKKFKYKKIKEIILENINLSLEEQKQKLETAFENWKGSLEQVDDICFIGIRV